MSPEQQGETPTGANQLGLFAFLGGSKGKSCGKITLIHWRGDTNFLPFFKVLTNL